VFTATPEIRAKFTGLTAIAVANKASALKPRHNNPDPVRHMTLVTIKILGQRIQYLRAEFKRLNRLIRPLIRQTAPALLEVYGVGFNTAAKLLVAAGDNPQRIRSEAAFVAPMRCRPDPSQLRQNSPAPIEPRRQQASKLGALPHRAHQDETRPSHPRLRLPPSRRGQNHG
jgi:hypothetical protein